MNDKPDLNEKALTLYRNRSLATKRAGLIKRGLELLPGLKKRQVRVAILGGLNGDQKFFTWLVEDTLEDRYDLKISSSDYVKDFLELAENGSVNIFILYLNYIYSCQNPLAWMRSDGLEFWELLEFEKRRPSEERGSLIAKWRASKLEFEEILQLITKIKAISGKPVIAISGDLPEDSIMRVKSVADFHFLFMRLSHEQDEQDAFYRAIKKCLVIRPEFDQI